MSRVVITGGPRTGKTTLATHLSVGGGTASFEDVDRDTAVDGARVRHTDDLIGKLEWSEASAEVSRWFDEPGPWIIEGVAVSRALRKWREAHPGEPPPVDRVIYLETPHVALTPRQDGMAKGVRRVHDEIAGWLEQHGVATEYL